MWAAGLALLWATEVDGPRVEVIESYGALDGPATHRSHPSWQRFKLKLVVENHLAVPVRNLLFELSLINAASDTHAPIPGWTFQDIEVERVFAPGSLTDIEVVLDLPERRRSLPSEEVAYRVRILSYRFDNLDLGLAVELVSSPHASDQRASLRSFEPQPSWTKSRRKAAASSMQRTIRVLPKRPRATDALRLLLAIRALGSLGRTEEVPLLLNLPERLDREAWGRAVIDLAKRMVNASNQEDPRLKVLPRWARRTATLLRVNARDALEEATREAILRLGEAAIPALVEAAATTSQRPDHSPWVRSRARRLLDRMGRSTPRAQIALRNREARIAVLRTLGRTRDSNAVPALIDALSSGGASARVAKQSLVAIGRSALLPLVEALGSADDGPIREALLLVGAAHPGELLAIAHKQGFHGSDPIDPTALVTAIRWERRRARVERLEGEITDAIALGARGAYRTALERLDKVYAEDPRLYLRHGDPIARLYVARAEQLLERGDFRAAIEVLSDGQTVRRLPEAEMRLTDARLALTQGFMDLDDLDQAKIELDAAPVQRRSDVLTMRGAWFEAMARKALTAGKKGEARRWVDKARALRPKDVGLRLLDRRILLAEHLSVVLVLALSLPALILALAAALRRWLERRKLEKLARAIDARA